MKHDFFKNTFFLSTTIEWNKSDLKIKNSQSIQTFKKWILSFIRPSPNSTFNCHNPKRIKLLSRLRLGLGYLRGHKFKHSFHDSLYKLRQNGISSELLNTLTDFLDNRTKRVILNGHYSSWAKLEGGVPNGPFLGHYCFLSISMIYLKI